MKTHAQHKSALLVLIMAGCVTALMVCQPLMAAFQSTAFAQSDRGVRMAAKAGFDGLCKDGDWIPVKVSLENQGEGLEASLQIRSDSLNGSPAVYIQPISLPSISHKETFIYFRPDQYQTEVEVQLVANRQIVTQAIASINCIANNDRLFGILSASPSSFNLLADLDPPNGRSSVARLAAGDLPDRAAALQAMDYLVISDLDTGSLTVRQIEALEGWVTGGGVLIVTGGPSWQRTAAGIDQLLPFHPDRSQTVSSLLDLPGETVLSAGDLDPSAEILIDQAGIPVLLRGRHGAGSVFYLTADPSLEPLKSWDGMLGVYEQIVNAESISPVWAEGFQAWDAAGSAVASLPELDLPGFNLLCGFLVVYIAAIGPLNYLVLRRLKRKELAWVSIPALVIVFSLLAFVVGSRGRGQEPVVSRLAVVQAWPDAQQADAYGLMGIYSPNRASYSLEIDRDFLLHPLANNPNLAPAGGWLFETTPDENTRIPEMRIDVAGINAFGLEGQIPSPAIDGELTIQLTNQGILLEGELHNRSNLRLYDAILLSPGETWQIGDFNPGDQQQVQIGLSDSDRASYQPATAAMPSYSGGPSVYYPPYAGIDSLASDLLGPGDYYRDQETYRRFSLLNAITGYSNPKGSGGGIYLLGWSESSPLPLQFSQQRFRSSDTTLYIISLQPAINQPDGPVALTPGLFTWSILDATSGVFNPSPYDSNLEGGNFSIQYVLSQPIPYTKVNQLTLHLKSYDTQGPTGFSQYLWDFGQSDWVLLPELDWGDTVIPDPQRFVGVNGDIRLRLAQPGSGAYYPIERADFTLEVEP
jgi:hypothetical protein